MTRHRIDAWTCPSGSNVEAYHRRVTDDGGIVELAWDRCPPLQPDDLHYYLVVIRPALIARLREYYECTGATLVLDL